MLTIRHGVSVVYMVTCKMFCHVAVVVNFFEGQGASEIFVSQSLNYTYILEFFIIVAALAIIKNRKHQTDTKRENHTKPCPLMTTKKMEKMNREDFATTYLTK